MSEKKPVDFDIKETKTRQYVITRNGKVLSREEVGKWYKILLHYPCNVMWAARYHLEQLMIWSGQY